jgi:hypothetical protein
MFYSVLSSFKRNNKGKFIYYFYKAVLSLMGMLTGIYGYIEIKSGRGKKFLPLSSFTPAKIVWRWDKNNNVKVINLNTRSGYHLHGTGARVWELFIEGRTEDEIVNVIKKENNINEEPLKTDIYSLLGEFKAENMIPEKM